jgi:hypothetical protein
MNLIFSLILNFINMAIEVERNEENSSEEEESCTSDESYDNDDDDSEGVCLSCIERNISLELEMLSLKLERLNQRLKDYYNVDNEETELVSDLYKSIEQIKELNSNLKS